MSCIDIDFEFESSFVSLKEVLKTIPIILVNTFPCISEEDLVELRLLFNELLSNAIIHGNKTNPSKKVQLMISMKDNLITGKIRDEGKGFDHVQVLNVRRHASVILEEEHGRGLILASNLADELVFNKSGNEVQFKKQLGFEMLASKNAMIS